MFDLRLPSGAFFAITGLILVVVGVVSNPHAPMSFDAGGSNVNVDLYTGLVMLAFGAFLLFLARRGRRA
ncbi:MAG: hypothetical protein ABUS51_07125 [Acidobacteriota bacterium]